ncbi:DUF433 domain-containing protein [Novosphingobium sp. NDB2Meth1]|uniref:DUF433 domain-containing protein n=1 Tax=Novosphingobium sp. NDB2Meth1 TaxID=1892847 RepID=UPI000930F952|nr:DUF433 domain-containing protein [Novosphingobium sp. NDB2Meth1]
MDWRDYIYTNPDIGFGKPIFRGTRIKVEFVLNLLEAGWTQEEIEESYPGIAGSHLQAAKLFAASV